MSKAEPAPPGRRRWLGRAVAVLLPTGLAAGAVLLAGGAWLVGTPAGNMALLARVLPLVQPPAGSIEVGDLQIAGTGEVVLTEISVRDAAGRELYGASSFTADLRLGALVGKRVVADRVVVDGLRVDLYHEGVCPPPGGPWDDGSPSSSSPWTGLPVDIDVRSLEIRGPLLRTCANGAAAELSAAQLGGNLSLHGPELKVGLDLFGALAAGPVVGPVHVRLDAGWDGEQALVEGLTASLGGNRAEVHGAVRDLNGAGALELTVKQLRVDPEGLGVEGLTGPLGFSGEVGGVFVAPQAKGVVTTPGGNASVSVELDLTGDRPSWKAEVDAESVALSQVLKGVPETTVGGSVVATGQGFGWPDDLDAEATLHLLASVAGGRAGPFGADGVVRVSGGTARAEGLELHGPGVALVVGGEVTVTASGARLDVDGLDVDLAELAAYGAPGLVGRVHFRGEVQGEWGEGVTASVDGVVDGTRVGYGGDVAVGTVRGRVAAQLVEEGLDLQAALDLGDVRAGSVAVATVHVVPEVHRSKSGELTGQIGWSHGGLRSDPYAADGGEGTVTLRGSALDVSARLQRAGAELLGVEGVVGLTPLDVQLSLLTVGLDPTRPWRNEGPVHLAQRPRSAGQTQDVWDIDTKLRSGEALVAVNGSASATGPLDLRTSVTAFPLDGVEGLYPGPLAGYRGALDATLLVTGTAAAPLVDLQARLGGLVVPDVADGVDLVASALSAGGGLRVDVSASSPGGALGRVRGQLPVRLDEGHRGVDPAGVLDVAIFVPPGDAERLNKVIPSLKLDPMRMSGEAHLTGTVVDPDLRITAALTLPLGPQHEWVSADLDANTVKGALDLRAVVRQRLARRAEVTGTASLDLARIGRSLFASGPAVDFRKPEQFVSDLSFDLVPLQLPIEALYPTGFAGLTGSLLGGVHISGSPIAPVVEGGIMIINGKLGRVSLSRAEMDVSPFGDAGYNLNVSLGMGADGGLTVRGLVPWRRRVPEGLSAELDRAGLAIVVAGSGKGLGLPLAALEAFVPGLSAAAGKLEVNGTITGSLRVPTPDLTFTIHEGAMTLADTGVAYRGVELGAHVSNDGIELDRLAFDTEPVVSSGLSFGGRDGPDRAVEIKGSAQLVDWLPAKVKGTVKLARARMINRSERRVQVSGDLDVSGTWPDLAFRGGLDVDSGHIVLSEAFFTRSDELGLDPDILIHRPGVASAVRAEEVSFPIPDLNVEVRLNRAVDVDVTLPTESMLGDIGSGLSDLRVQADLDGELTVVATDGVLDIAGSVQPLRGKATVLGKPFVIRDDPAWNQVVAFTGRDFTSPLLDVTAVYTTRDSSGSGTKEDIRAHIRGSADSPAITFDSSDEGRVQDDIVAILLFGKPASELAASGGGGTNELLQLVLAGLANQMKDASTIRTLDLMEVASSSVTGVSARVGKRIGRNVMVIVTISPFTTDITEETYAVAVELQLPEHWVLSAETGITVDSTNRTKVAAHRQWRF